MNSMTRDCLQPSQPTGQTKSMPAHSPQEKLTSPLLPSSTVPDKCMQTLVESGSVLLRIDTDTTSGRVHGA